MEPTDDLMSKIQTDAEARSAFLAEPADYLRGHGIEVPEGTSIEVVEDSASVRHCVLPPAPQGDVPEPTTPMESVISKAWRDEAYKARLLADPASTLAEAGVNAPANGPELKFVESTDDRIYMVLPAAGPGEGGELSDDDLEGVAGGFLGIGGGDCEGGGGGGLLGGLLGGAAGGVFGKKSAGGQMAGGAADTAKAAASGNIEGMAKGAAKGFGGHMKMMMMGGIGGMLLGGMLSIG